MRLAIRTEVTASHISFACADAVVSHFLLFLIMVMINATTTTKGTQNTKAASIANDFIRSLPAFRICLTSHRPSLRIWHRLSVRLNPL